MGDEQIFQELAQYLRGIGLGSLFSVDESGKPSGWLWEQIVNGVDSPEALLFPLEQTPEFRQRFSIIFEMRDAATRGELNYAPTVADVLNYEREYVRAMTAAGVPSWFYDSLDDAHRAMRTNLSVTQIADRVERGFTTMQEMPVEVRDAFTELYGNEAESVLLAAVLDPEKTLAEIDRSVRAAQISGFGRRAGLDVTAEQASRFSQAPLTLSEIETGVQEAARLAPLTEETIGESGTDLSSEVALSAGILGSARDEAILEARLTGRQLRQRATAGGAVAGQSGITGASVV
jgi:hypothetical protein